MPRFVGRRDEVARLVTVVEAARPGVPAAAMVVGEPGIGKSSLLEAVTRKIEGPVVTARGYELERSVALGAARDLLAALAPLDGLPGESLGTAEPVELFERAHRRLEACSSTVLVIDDLQWFDEMSLALLHYLVRGAVDGRHQLAVLVASRPSDTATRVGDSLTRMLRAPARFVAFELGPLDIEDGVALVADLAPGHDAHIAQTFYQRAGGNPFWLRALVTSPDAEGTAPSRLLLDRLLHLGPDPSLLLGLLSVADRPLLVPEVPDIVQWPEERSASAFERLADTGLAMIVHGTYRLTHDLVRETVAAEMPAETIRRLHLALARWSEREDSALALLNALEHRKAAGESALGVAVRIASLPERRLIGREGLARLAAVADAAGFTGEALALHREAARLAEELGDAHVALERWGLVLERSVLPIDRAEAAIHASRAALILGDAERAGALLRSAEAESRLDQCLAIEWLSQHATVLRWLPHDPDEARSASEQAVELARALVAAAGGAVGLDVPTRAACLQAFTTAADAAMLDDRPPAEAALAAEMTEIARGGDDEGYLQAVLRTFSPSPFDDVVVSVERAQQVWEEAQRRVLPPTMLDAAYWLIATRRAMGDLVGAERVATEAVRIGRRAGDRSLTRHPVRILASLVALSRSHWQQAIADLEAAAKPTANAHFRLSLHRDAALWRARLDRSSARLAESVVDRLDAAFADAAVTDCRRCLGELRLRAAEALARVGRTESAAPLLDQWDATHESPDGYWLLVRTWVGALATGPGRQAVAALERVVRDADHLSLGLDGLWARLDLAAAVRDAEPDRAIDLLSEMLRRASEGGALTEVAVAEQELRALGVRARRRGSRAERHPEHPELSQREWEVAVLAAAGSSNPEIAAALFLSRRTVERHISNVLTKVGLRNRAELAAWVSQHRPSSP